MDKKWSPTWVNYIIDFWVSSDCPSQVALPKRGGRKDFRRSLPDCHSLKKWSLYLRLIFSVKKREEKGKTKDGRLLPSSASSSSTSHLLTPCLQFNTNVFVFALQAQKWKSILFSHFLREVQMEKERKIFNIQVNILFMQSTCVYISVLTPPS